VLRRPLVPLVLFAALALLAPAAAMAHGDSHRHGHGGDGVKNIVVIYQENHSFDNLFGRWEGVNGVVQADAGHTTQVGQSGTAYSCLLQKDVNLTSPPLSADCTDSTTPTAFTSHFANHPFAIDDFISPTDTT
jgi:phospholipase C